MINIQIQGLNKINNKLSTIKHQLNTTVETSFSQVGNKIIEDANSNLYSDVASPNHSERDISQSIKEGWHIQTDKSPGGIEMTIYNTSPHAPFPEYGTGIYSELGGGGLIYPTHSPFLRFKMDGKYYELPYIKGQQPKAYFRNAIFPKQQSISDSIKATFRGLIDTIGE